MSSPLPYKDASRSVGDRIADLIARMTLPEKVGQMLQLDARPLREARVPVLVAETDALLAAIDEADSLAASRVIIVQPPSRLLIAVSAQYRYFTPSRARLLALGLVHEHAPVLLGDMSV